MRSAGEDPTPYIHYALSQRPDAGAEIIARAHGDAATLVGAMRRELLALEPNLLFQFSQTLQAGVDTPAL